MPLMPRIKVTSLRALEINLSKRALKVTGPSKEKVVGVTVGYNIYYAVYVHENLAAHHPVGEAKYLTKAVAAKQDDAKKALTASLKKGNSLGKALYNFGQSIQYESQRRVPYKTGLLYRSAYTKLTRYTGPMKSS